MTTPAISPNSPLRRIPSQGRSVARVQRILDACGALIDEIGYDRLSTGLIAERADVAIGSVYQFFPDKRAIVRALALHNLETYLNRLRERFSLEGIASWQDGVSAGIDEYVAAYQSMPGFCVLHLHDMIGPRRTAIDSSQIIGEHLAQALVEQIAVTDTPRMRLHLQIAVTAADALIARAFRQDPAGDEKVFSEARALAHSCLRNAFDGASVARDRDTP